MEGLTRFGRPGATSRGKPGNRGRGRRKGTKKEPREKNREREMMSMERTFILRRITQGCKSKG